MRTLGPAVCVAAVLALSFPLAASAQAPEACASQPAATSQPVGWFEAWQKLKADLEKATGTSFCLLGITSNQVVLNGPGEGKDRTVFWWNLNVTQKLWDGAKLVSNTRGGDGDGLAGIDGSTHCTNWMRGEPDPVYVSHLYLQQKLFDNKLTIDAGKLDLGDYFDTNEVASWDFLSYSLARNPTIPFPWHAIGAVVRVDPTDWLYVEAGAADAQGNATQTGLNTAFHDEDHFIGMWEAGLRPKLGGRQGNYRFGMWYDPRVRTRLHSLDSEDGPVVEQRDCGFTVSFDQEITDKVSLFFRYGLADQHVRDVANFWSTGASWKSPIGQRPGDALVFGVGQMIFGRDYREVHASSSTETIFELYYKFRLTPWCSLSPDLQVILNPGASRDEDVGVIGGLKMVLEF